jgi:tetratricopeptide (TPR) repeat protein
MSGLKSYCKSAAVCVRLRLVFLLSLQSVEKADFFMSLRASLLRTLENPNISVNDRVDLCCEVTRKLENRGEYEEARKVLSDYWPRIGEAPNVAGLEPNTAAELLLRVGVLTGIIGTYRQIPDAQETAKDLLTQSQSIFEAHQVIKKIAEVRTELAYCYWRTNDLDAARNCLKEAFAHLTTDSELKAKAILRLSIVEHSAHRDQKAFRMLTKYESLFLRVNNHTLKGCYFTVLGDRLVNLAELGEHPDYIDRALIEYAAASYYLELSGHRQYLANVETNLGYLFFKINHFNEANEHLNRARRIYVRIKDARTAAQVDETRARILLEQGRLREAERVIRSAVRVQEKGGNTFLLTEALITYGRVLARTKRYGESLATFRRTVALSDQAGLVNRATEAMVAVFRELGEYLAVSEGGQLLSGFALGQDRLSRERELIKLALEQSKGKISPAARSLGVSWQWLSYALRTRFPDLQHYRTPARPRKRKE